MMTFLAVYVGSPMSAQSSGWGGLSEAERQSRAKEGIAAWHRWNEANKDAIVEIGAPLGRTKSVSGEGIKDISNNLTGFTLVRAESHEAAAKLFEGHPHFAVFPGEAVEIMPCMPIPSMS